MGKFIKGNFFKGRMFTLFTEGLICVQMMISAVRAFQVAKKVPNLKIEYEVDSRQQIADSWPMVGSPHHSDKHDDEVDEDYD